MANGKIIEQAKGFFGKLSTAQKVSALIVTVALGVGVILLLVALSGDKTEYGTLYSEVEGADAAKIVDYLKENKIAYQLEDNGSRIMVDREKLYEARIALAGEGLPGSGTVGYELFDQANLGMSEYVQKLNHQRALEGELQKTIGSIEEIKKVRVHIVTPEKTLFKEDEKPPTASVALHLKSGRTLQRSSVRGIQNLVASSIEGMSPDNVMIIDSRGKALSEAALDENSVAGLTASQHEQQQKVERYIADKVQTLLNGVVGPDNAAVRVNADLDFTKIEQTRTDFDPERQVIRSEQNLQERSVSSDSLSYPAVNQSKDQSNVISNYEISKTVEHIIQGVGNVKRLSVSVLVNGTNKVVENGQGVKSLRYIPRPKEEMDQLDLAVKNAVGYDPNRNDQISVLNVPFDASWQEQELEDSKPVDWWTKPGNQKLIALAVAMLMAMLIMWRLFSSRHIKERVRIALSLPAKVSIDDDKVAEDMLLEEEKEENFDAFDDFEMKDGLALLPADLPEQLLLEGEREYYNSDDSGEGLSLEGSTGSLATRGSAYGESDTAELTEDTMMKLEIKNKVETYIDGETEEAVKLVRMLLAQDYDYK